MTSDARAELRKIAGIARAASFKGEPDLQLIGKRYFSAPHGCRSRSKVPMVSSKQRIPAQAFSPISQGRNVHFRTGMHSHGHSREVSRVVVKWDSIVVSTSPER